MRRRISEETVEEQAARAARLLRQGAAITTWSAPRTATGTGLSWADRQHDRDHALAWSERRV